jgi:acyl-CoA thioesterase
MTNEPDHSPRAIVEHMLANDPFSRWMSVELQDVSKGFCSLRCEIREEMHNGFSVTHGGILFSLADSAIAFAAATYGRVSLAVDHSISFIRKTEAGRVLTTKAQTISMGNKMGFLRVEIHDEENNLVATVKGTVYRSNRTFEL